MGFLVDLTRYEQRPDHRSRRLSGSREVPRGSGGDHPPYPGRACGCGWEHSSLRRRNSASPERLATSCARSAAATKGGQGGLKTHDIAWSRRWPGQPLHVHACAGGRPSNSASFRAGECRNRKKAACNEQSNCAPDFRVSAGSYISGPPNLSAQAGGAFRTLKGIHLQAYTLFIFDTIGASGLSRRPFFCPVSLVHA